MKHVRILCIVHALVYLLACAGPDKATTNTLPANTSQESDHSSLDDIKKLEQTSSDPVLVWINALEESSVPVINTALNHLFSCKDRRAIDPLRNFITRWAPKSSHDGPALGAFAAHAILNIEARLAWDESVPSSLVGEAKLVKILELSRGKPSNLYTRDLIRQELFKSNDERIIPFLIGDGRQESKDKLKTFGKRAGPYLMEAAFKGGSRFEKDSAMENLGFLKIEEGVKPMVRMLRNIRARDLSRKPGGPINKEVSTRRSMLMWSLGHYGEETLDAIIPELEARDPLVRDSFYAVLGRIGGHKAFWILQQARNTEVSRDNSDGVNVLKTITFYIQRIRRIQGGGK